MGSINMESTTDTTLNGPPESSTRVALQTLAEHLLAADLFSHTGRVGLRTTQGGFGQPEFFVDGQRRRLRVDGTRLAVLRGDVEVWTEISTLRTMARFSGAELGAPGEVFSPTTALDPDAEIVLDPNETRHFAEFYAQADTALEMLRSQNTRRSPAIVQLWPEHFDLATNMSEINFGASPGDATVSEPYFYVGPWAPRTGGFWNAPFGAVLLGHEASGVGDVLGFFTEGLRLATT